MAAHKLGIKMHCLSNSGRKGDPASERLGKGAKSLWLGSERDEWSRKTHRSAGQYSPLCRLPCSGIAVSTLVRAVTFIKAHPVGQKVPRSQTAAI